MEKIDRAKKYLEKVPGAIAGQAGDTWTFRIACILVAGFDLQQKDALAVLRDWNKKCSPPWEEEELEQKLTNAVLYAGEPKGNKNKMRADQLGVKTVYGFEAIPLKDFLLKDFGSLNAFVSNLLFAGGLSLLSSKPKTGKTSILKHLALCLARGENFLNRSSTKTKVLFFALEENAKKLQEAFKEMSASDEDILIITRRPKQDVREAFIEIVKKHSPCFIIVDTLGKLERIEDFNSYSEVSSTIAEYESLARETNSHILLSHHLSKGDKDSEDGILGSTALFGAVDTAIFLRKDSDGKRSISTTQRYGDSMEPTYIKMLANKSFELLGSKAEVYESNIDERILECLSKGRLTEKEVRDLVKGKTKEVSNRLRSLAQSGAIYKTGTGKKNDPFLYELDASSPLRKQ